MALSQTALSHKDGIFMTANELTGGQFAEGCRIDRLCVELPVKRFECAGVAKGGGFQSPLDSSLATFDGWHREEAFKHRQVRCF